MRWLVLLVGLVTVVLMTAASFPGPWHEDGEGQDHDCQCPVCKIVSHGLLQSFATLHVDRPLVSVHLVSTEQPSLRLEAFVYDHPARAPPA
jgi:hypothetical protein